jgi:hypothetical protein
MSDLKLGKLPDRSTVKLTINVSPDLKRGLDDYAALYSERYGNPEPIGELVPAMLTTFLESDRAFVASQKGVRKP